MSKLRAGIYLAVACVGSYQYLTSDNQGFFVGFSLGLFIGETFLTLARKTRISNE